MAIRMKRGDLRPTLRLTLLDDGTPVSLVDAESAVLIVRKGTADPVIDRADMSIDEVDDDTIGHVSYEWAAGDTDTAGTFHLEVEVAWPGAEPQTFPTVGYEVLVIGADLG